MKKKNQGSWSSPTLGLRALSPSPATLILTRLSLFGELLFYSDDGDDGKMVMTVIIDERL